MATEMTCGIAPLAAILRFSKEYPVFPCRRMAEVIDGKVYKEKSPLTRRGFLDASQDEAQITSWWQKWPDALVGVPTGSRTGITVVDVDPRKFDEAGRDWFEQSTNLLLTTRAHGTLHDGFHYVFSTTVTPGYASTQNATLSGRKRGGVDIRGEGGYVVWWTLHGCSRTGALAPLPAGLIDEYRIKGEKAPPLAESTPEKWLTDRELAREALRHIDPDCDRQTWITILAAVHLASGGSRDGFDLIHEWSSGELTGTNPLRYAGMRDCAYAYTSFKHDGNRRSTLGTIFHLARQNGWKEGEAFDFSDAAPEPEGAPKDTPREDVPPVVFRHVAEIVAEQREPEWLLDDVIEANILAVLAGPRGTFKSFVALDWSMRIAATGLPVVILSGEGAGLDRRVDAWVRTHGAGRAVAEFPVYALERALNLNAAVELVNLKAAVERMERKPALIVVDTFSKFSAGLDENDNGEVSTYLARLSRSIREIFGTTVLLVAHSGHADAARPRGASALMANPDAEYIIARPAPGAMSVSVTRERFKDSPALAPLWYDATVIDLGRQDRRGQPVTSLAMVPGAPVTAPVKGAGKNQTSMLVALKEFHRNQPDSRFLSSFELAAMFKQQGIPAKRKPEVLNWLVNAGILNPSIGGHSFDPSNL